MTLEELERDWLQYGVLVPTRPLGEEKIKPLSQMYPFADRLPDGLLIHNGMSGLDSNGHIIKVDENDECWLKVFYVYKGKTFEQWKKFGKLAKLPHPAVC